MTSSALIKLLVAFFIAVGFALATAIALATFWANSGSLPPGFTPQVGTGVPEISGEGLSAGLALLIGCWIVVRRPAQVSSGLPVEKQ